MQKQARERAWEHVARATAAGQPPGLAGHGPLCSGDVVKYHGYEDAEHVFYVHPKKATLGTKDLSLWRPAVDTHLPAKVFCTNCTFVHRTGTGVETWRCGGHESATVDPPAPQSSESTAPAVVDDKGPADDTKTDLTEFPGAPLEGRRFVECFSGDPAKEGGRLSRSWERAGGAAELRDILISSSHDFLKDDKFWKAEEKKPADAYQFAPPCTSFSIAHTTPVVRTKENPYGDSADPAVAMGNTLLLATVRRTLLMLAAGGHVMIEHPLMSYGWLFKEVQALMGSVGMYLVRIDQCTTGTPFQKPQLWLTSNAELAKDGAVCYHPRPHPETLAGTRTRHSAPYPARLADTICHSFDRQLKGQEAPRAANGQL